MDVCFQTGKDSYNGRQYKKWPFVEIKPATTAPHTCMCKSQCAVLYQHTSPIRSNYRWSGSVPSGSSYWQLHYWSILSHVGDDLTAHSCALSYPTNHWFRIGRCTAMSFVCISSLQLLVTCTEPLNNQLYFSFTDGVDCNSVTTATLSQSCGSRRR